MSANGQKDTIYIDVDDEITAIIDKLRGSPHKIVALVLPKRAAVLSSIVNMKLLKRSADTMKKQAVLITSESALMPLAGAAELYVAKTLQSKPELPPGPSDIIDGPISTIEGEAPLDPNATVGSLADQTDGESIEVDNSPDKSSLPSTDKSKKSKGDKSKKPKIKVPNFEKFRTRLILGVAGVVLLIVLYVLAFMVLPKATITLKTDDTTAQGDVTFTADTIAKAFDPKAKVLPAMSKEFRRTDTERVAATGQKDLGQKATGSIVLTNCSESTGNLTLPAGTGISTGNLTYITNEAVDLPESSFTGGEHKCKTSSSTVSVTADKPGDQYNVDSGKSFAVAGYSKVEATNNSPMSGGTSNVVKVVSKADIDKGTQAIQNRANDTAPDELTQSLKDKGYYPIKETLVSGNPTVTTDHNVDDQVDNVAVTSTTVYTMVGVKEADLNKLIQTQAETTIDKDKQVVRNTGLSKAKFSVQNTKTNATTIYVQSIATVGPQLDDNEIKQEIAGKKRGDTKKLILARPGIKDADISYSPFWVSTTPKKTDKIKVIFETQK